MDYYEAQENKVSISSGYFIYEAILLGIIAVSIFISIAIFSFDPTDPGWTQTTHLQKPIANLAGQFGAYTADSLFFLFGQITYAIPFLLIIFSLLCWRKVFIDKYLNFFSLSFKLIGLIFIMLSSCVLASLNIDDTHNFSSGGIIGNILTSLLFPQLNSVGTTLLMLFIWILSFSLLTQLSPLSIAEKIGDIVLLTFTFGASRDKHVIDDLNPELENEDDIYSFMHEDSEHNDENYYAADDTKKSKVKSNEADEVFDAENDDDVLLRKDILKIGANRQDDNQPYASKDSIEKSQHKSVRHEKIESTLDNFTDPTENIATQANSSSLFSDTKSDIKEAGSTGNTGHIDKQDIDKQDSADLEVSTQNNQADSIQTHTIQTNSIQTESIRPESIQNEPLFNSNSPNSNTDINPISTIRQNLTQPENSEPNNGSHTEDNAEPIQRNITIQQNQQNDIAQDDSVSDAQQVSQTKPIFIRTREAREENRQQSAIQNSDSTSQFINQESSEPTSTHSESTRQNQETINNQHTAAQSSNVQNSNIHGSNQTSNIENSNSNARVSNQSNANQSNAINQPNIGNHSGNSMSAKDTAVRNKLAAFGIRIPSSNELKARYEQKFNHGKGSNNEESITSESNPSNPILDIDLTPNDFNQDSIVSAAQAKETYQDESNQDSFNTSTFNPIVSRDSSQSNFIKIDEDTIILNTSNSDQLSSQDSRHQGNGYQNADFQNNAFQNNAFQNTVFEYANSENNNYEDNSPHNMTSLSDNEQIDNIEIDTPKNVVAESSEYPQTTENIDNSLRNIFIKNKAPESGFNQLDDDESQEQYAVNEITPTSHQVEASEAYYFESQTSKPYEHADEPEYEDTNRNNTQEYQPDLFHPFLVRDTDDDLEKPKEPLPTLDLLYEAPNQKIEINEEELRNTAQLIENTLADFRIKVMVVEICTGPVITRFELELAPGVKVSRISSLDRDLARALSVSAVRVVEVIPGKPYVGLELPNPVRQTLVIRDVLNCDEFIHMKSPLAMVLGKDIAGEPVVANLAKMPHLLVAGTTGSGKSVGVNAMIISILYKASPEDVRFIMIDPKMLELSVYEGIPHLLTNVVTDMKDASNALRWCVAEMDRRYKLMAALGVRNLDGYNEKIAQAAEMERPIPDPFWKPSDSMGSSIPHLIKLPFIVVIVDEFADLMMTEGKKVEELIARLAQKARAAGIHLVLATQRPSVDVITGLIKANIPTRIAFTVSSKIDSRTILDQGGAESLLGAGDMLYLPPNSSTTIRVHGAFVRDEEVHKVVANWKARGRPQYIDAITAGDKSGEGENGSNSDEQLDPMFDQAVQFVIEKQRVSISALQRRFKVGFNRAAKMVEEMEEQGIVSAPGHNGNREVLAQ